MVALDDAEERGIFMPESVARLYGDTDWQNAFAYAKDFDWPDIKRVVKSDAGGNDDVDWLAVFELRDGRFAFLHAGCDYTGWGCQEWGDSEIHETLDDLVRLGLDNSARSRLSLWPADEDYA